MRRHSLAELLHPLLTLLTSIWTALIIRALLRGPQYGPLPSRSKKHTMTRSIPTYVIGHRLICSRRSASELDLSAQATLSAKFIFAVPHQPLGRQVRYWYFTRGSRNFRPHKL